ncbi:protein CASPARIAN STRIP INTEGRITY FACTOR 1-like [Rutidosis leptorrhynchoides]|uniref:protein CASPARIAN STRIP INTEGRITY FACTOR 1-like n=1 Tax=Rutidosis leptorrhynchoides TaxID=125765 RepID=UPI003A9A649F
MKIIMDFKIYLLTLLIVASFVSSSSAARCGSFIPMAKVDENQESLYLEDDQVSNRDDIHERLLRANTKDYGRPDPAPTFVKPPFKLIPN